MKEKSRSDGRYTMVRVLWNLVLLATGSAVCAVAINGILIPQGFLGSGYTGLALVIHYLVPVLPVSGIFFALNIPVFALGWLYVGRRFFLFSLAGMVFFSLAVEFVQVSIAIEDPILAALLAGILTGAGWGCILRSWGSAGGTDILAVIFQNILSIRLGTTILFFNVVVLASGAILFSMERALYTLIFIYVSAHLVNLVVWGLSQRKAVFIVSPEWRKMSQAILNEIGRGVTVLYGRGGYSGRSQQILYSVITFRELSRIKQALKRIDPEAFMVTIDTMEVLGSPLGNQPHW